MGGPRSTRDEKYIQIFVGKPEGKRTLGRPRCIWNDNTGLDLWEIRCEVVDWIHLAQDRDLAGTVMNLSVPYRAENFFTSRAAVSQEGPCCMQLLVR